MANKLFQNFPTMQYRLNDGKIITIKDFFRKAKIETNAVDSIIEYQYYEVLDGERPDVVASKLYGDGDLHWTFWLVNDFDNYYDWFMGQETFGNYMEEKYQGQCLVASNSSDIVSSTSKFLIGETVTSNVAGKTASVLKVEPTHKCITVLGDTMAAGETISSHDKDGTVVKTFTVSSVSDSQDGVHHYVDSNNNYRTYGGSGWTAVTHFTKEYEDNEKKRQIKIIKPSRIRRVVTEFERIMSDG